MTEPGDAIVDLLTALPETTPRGFRYLEFEFTDYRGEPARTFSVQESSLATESRLWVGPTDTARAHLDEDAVRTLRDALSAWLAVPADTTGDPQPVFDPPLTEAEEEAFIEGMQWQGRMLPQATEHTIRTLEDQ